jgi:hypothetical protein
MPAYSTDLCFQTACAPNRSASWKAHDDGGQNNSQPSLPIVKGMAQSRNSNKLIQQLLHVNLKKTVIERLSKSGGPS